MTELVTRIDTDGLAPLTLNRPEKLNALNGGLFYELEAQITAIATATNSIGAVAIKGAVKCF
ncbi:Clp protease/crotonase-like domain-containing protein [Ferribacterium limneticum]|uniref:hypothetical protein n=1 Tax=Ferribacterium limneticum TaxID=76259 RepID=UPI001CF84FB0|nr:hypothetical protein [Ferribacterium limneticum]UCV23652.1 hypothetical protein KI613_03690 [Ferribacterium limneticum]